MKTMVNEPLVAQVKVRLGSGDIEAAVWLWFKKARSHGVSLQSIAHTQGKGPQVECCGIVNVHAKK